MRILFCMATLFLISCSEDFSEEVKKVRVGMTYEEVEEVLGKPQRITRGFSKLVVTKINPAVATIKDLFSRDDRENLVSISVDFLSKYPDTASIEIEEGGDLIYVRWDYGMAPIRTATTNIGDVPVIVCDTSYVQGLKYFVSGAGKKQEVSKQQYNELASTIRTKDPSAVLALSEAIDFKMWSEKGRVMRFSNYRLREKTKMHVVMWKQFVLFDASSGRVTSTDYQPIHCSYM